MTNRSKLLTYLASGATAVATIVGGALAVEDRYVNVAYYETQRVAQYKDTALGQIQIQLELVEVKIQRLVDIQSRRRLSPDEADELDSLRDQRRLLRRRIQELE